MYSGSVDVWSVGCILAEMIRRKPLLPASNEKEQMEMIATLLGTPSRDFINNIEDEKARSFMENIPKKAGINFETHFKNANPQAIDLLKKMLTIDPEKRITVQQALEHPYLAKLHAPEDEPSGQPVSDFDFDFELYSLKTQEYKQLIFEEIELYHSETARQAYKLNKKEHPGGILNRRFGKERLRTMYKKDEKILEHASTSSSTSSTSVSKNAKNIVGMKQAATKKWKKADRK